MSRRVEWSSSAINDLELTIAHIAQDNPAAARKVALGIGRSASALGTHPTGRPGRVPGSYEKSVTGLPYVIAYAVPDDTMIVVLRVIHTVATRQLATPIEISIAPRSTAPRPG